MPLGTAPPDIPVVHGVGCMQWSEARLPVTTRHMPRGSQAHRTHVHRSSSRAELSPSTANGNKLAGLLCVNLVLSGNYSFAKQVDFKVLQRNNSGEFKFKYLNVFRLILKRGYFASKYLFLFKCFTADKYTNKFLQKIVFQINFLEITSWCLVNFKTCRHRIYTSTRGT